MIVKANSQNQQPVTAPDRPTVRANSANNVFYVLTNDYDPDGDLLTITNVTLPAFAELPIIVDGGRAVRFTPKPHQFGSDGFSYDVSDGKGGAKRERVWITIEAADPPRFSITDPAPTTGNLQLPAGVTTNLLLSFESPIQNIIKVEYYSGQDKIGEVTAGNMASFAWKVRKDQCECGIYAIAYDKFGQVGTSLNIARYQVVPPTTNFPVATISSPGKEYYVMGGVPQLRTTIVQDGILVVTGSAYRTNTVTHQTDAPEYKVIIYSPEGAIVRDTGWILAAAPIFNSAIITNDLTTLRNDVYELELLVRDDYQTVSDKVQFALDSNLKIGPFTFSEQDMVIPVNGLPLTVVRTYDSMNPNKGDFGYSWTYAINDLDVTLHETRANRRPLFDDEEGNQPGGMFSLRVAGSRDVTLTLPDGRRATFYYYEVPGDCGGDDGVNLCAEPRYFSPPGVTAKLRPVNKYGGDVGGYDFYTKIWKAAGGQTAHENFDFPGFILTLQDGTEFYITRQHEGDFLFLPDDAGNEDDGFGEITSPNNFIVSPYGKPRVAEIRQRSGNRIVINPDGFVDGKNQFSVDHFNTQNQKTRSIHFVRDDQGRISEIRDPISGSNGTAVVKYVYDSANNLSKVLKLVNRSTGSYMTNLYFYENSQFPHYLTKIIDARGNQVARNLYDELGRLIGIIDASGRTNRFEHDLANNREIQYDRLGNATIHMFDNRGNVTNIINALGYATSMQYENDYVVALSDPLGNTSTFTRDDTGNALSVTLPHPAGADPAAYTTRFTYTDIGDESSIQLPTGGVITNAFDAGGQLLETRDETGRLMEKLTWDNGEVHAMEDRMGIVLNFQYDSVGNLTNAIGPGGQASSSYDANGNVTNVAISGLSATVQYDAQNRETVVDAGNGPAISFTIGNEPEWTEMSSPTIGTIVRTFDEQGRLSRVVYPNGSSAAYCYDAEGRVEFETNTLGQVTQFTYDPAGRIIATTNLSLGIGASFDYDAANRAVGSKDPLGNATRYAYNPDGSVAAMTNALGNVWTYSYETAVGCCGGDNVAVTETDPLGRQKINMTSPHQLPLQMVFRSGTNSSTNSITYWLMGDDPDDDPENFVESITDEGGHIRRFGYTQYGMLERASDLSGANFWTNVYDGDGTLTNMVSPTGEKTIYVYENQDLLKAVRFPDGNWLTNTYNLTNNHLNSTRLPSGVVINFLRDEAGRVTNRTSTAGETFSFKYSADNQITVMQDSTGSTTNFYDADGRLFGTDFPTGASVRYSFDAVGRISMLTSKANGAGPTYTNQYHYDQVGNLTNMTAHLNGQVLPTHFEYDRVNRRTRRVLPNGIVTRYEYDWRDRVTNIVHQNANGEVLASASYVRQAAGEPTKIVREDGTYVLLGYDQAWRLTNEVHYSSGGVPQRTNSYGYDASGTRIRFGDATGIYTNAVQQGFRITEVRNASNGSLVESFTYDVLGRVTSLSNATRNVKLGFSSMDTLIASTNASSTNLYVYDAAGRRTRAVDNGVTERRFVIGQAPGGSVESPILVSDASGSVKQGYVYVGNTPLFRFDASGNPIYYLEDAVGSVVAIADNANPTLSTTTRLFYDGFGLTSRTNGPNPTIPSGTGGDFRFQGEWIEAANGLYHMRARDYDPHSGRFVSRDPAEGDFRMPETLHPYSFANNNPYVYSDPSGAFSLTEITLATAIQFILHTLKAVVIAEVKATAMSKVTDFARDQFFSVLKHYVPYLDFQRFMKEFRKNPKDVGGDFDVGAFAALCFVVKNAGGSDIYGKYIHHQVAVRNGGPNHGRPRTVGRNCNGVNDGFLPVPDGLVALAFHKYPDFIIGKPPLTAARQPQETELDGEFKSTSGTLLKAYVTPGYNREQLDAINAYAARHTKWRTSIFIVGYHRGILTAVIDRKTTQLSKVILYANGTKKGVLNLYVPLKKKK